MFCRKRNHKKNYSLKKKRVLISHNQRGTTTCFEYQMLFLTNNTQRIKYIKIIYKRLFIYFLLLCRLQLFVLWNNREKKKKK